MAQVKTEINYQLSENSLKPVSFSAQCVQLAHLKSQFCFYLFAFWSDLESSPNQLLVLLTNAGTSQRLVTGLAKDDILDFKPETEKGRKRKGKSKINNRLY